MGLCRVASWIPARTVPRCDDAWVRTLVIGSGSDTEVLIAGRGDIPATGLGAVAINFTVTDPTTDVVFDGVAQLRGATNSSTLNLQSQATLANMAIVPVRSNGGKIDLWNNSGFVYGIVDVLGYFPPASSFVGLLPTAVDGYPAVRAND